ncbi:hypothetical protein [Blastopirellula marina]|uniref:Uncharacterized protein n=1 Tax=Blastopirellula marina TaxID=124 RepID=A0A2S8G910_9BACT|nr:hypothetical protein [Blastopirellula marina]PQO40945.1 hypothetical protein C5Y98_05030 [Blastopirellula marina]PTL45827.1 hypothetical protein C5Y97_05030 [Blastopirellula marina]
MTDDEFLATFEKCTLPSEQWTHAAHVRAAFLIANQSSWSEALSSIRSRIQAYNAATDTPEAIDRGYHETITQAFMRLVYAANLQTGPHATAEQFCQRHPELLEKRALFAYYSRDRLMTWEAKREFIEPDLQPLPIVEIRTPD